MKKKEPHLVGVHLNPWQLKRSLIIAKIVNRFKGGKKK